MVVSEGARCLRCVVCVEKVKRNELTETEDPKMRKPGLLNISREAIICVSDA